MTSNTAASHQPNDTELERTSWDLEPLVDGAGRDGARAQLDQALEHARTFAAAYAGKLAELDGAGLERAMRELAEIQELVGRAGTYAGLRFSVDTADPATGALMQEVQERATEIETTLLFFELEWAALEDAQAEALLEYGGLSFCAHYLRTARRYRGHLLSEPEEKILAEKAVTGAAAWSRLFDELTSAIEVRLPAQRGGDATATGGRGGVDDGGEGGDGSGDDGGDGGGGVDGGGDGVDGGGDGVDGGGDGVDGGGDVDRQRDVAGAGAQGRADAAAQATETVALDVALSRLVLPDRELRRATAQAVTEALAPGLRTRAFLFNTLLADKATDDRLRHYPTWLAARNLSNEASDESVAALIEAVRARYELPRRWYRLKAKLLGVERLADYDRMAAVSEDEVTYTFAQARELVLDCYGSFSPKLGEVAARFFEGRYIDAPVRPGKRGGAFCASAVPTAHPYVMLNYTSRRRDVLTLAHELGHGVHFALAAEQGIFHQGTPLTLAETASVFGETIVFGRLLEEDSSPDSRLALLAENIEGALATVFRQVAMNRFEELVHTSRREQGELSVERFGELWCESQQEMFGDSVEITAGYRGWWSYIPHFIGSPGYVYAYAYGQLLALSVYQRYEQQGEELVPRYLELLASGGSRAPEELGQIVGIDLADPGFWDAGLDLVERQLQAAEEAARDAGWA